MIANPVRIIRSAVLVTDLARLSMVPITDFCGRGEDMDTTKRPVDVKAYRSITLASHVLNKLIQSRLITTHLLTRTSLLVRVGFLLLSLPDAQDTFLLRKQLLTVSRKDSPSHIRIPFLRPTLNTGSRACLDAVDIVLYGRSQNDEIRSWHTRGLIFPPSSPLTDFLRSV